jgi:hypothetical protein
LSKDGCFESHCFHWKVVTCFDSTEHLNRDACEWQLRHESHDMGLVLYENK